MALNDLAKTSVNSTLNKYQQGSQPMMVEKERNKEFLESAKEQIFVCKKRIESLEKSIKEVQECKFKPGQYVLHREYGKGIIGDVFVADQYASYRTSNGRAFVEGTLLAYGSFYKKGQFTNETVSINELLEYNEATKVLYDDK